MAAVCILLAVAALLIVLFSLHIKVNMSFTADGDNKIELRYGFLKFRILPKKARDEVRTEKTEDKRKEEKKRDNGRMLKLLKAVHAALKDGLFKIAGYILTKAVTVSELNISADFGLDDPAETGIAAGAAYAAVYNMIGLMDRHMKLKERTVSITPDFDEEKFLAGAYASLYTNIWHIFVIGGMFIKTAVKILYKAWRLRKNEQSSE